MKLWELESALQDLEKWESPRVELEQYASSGELAAKLLWQAEMENDLIDGGSVLDLGCGNGIYGIGAAILGASHVTFVDIDESSLELAKRNVEELFEEDSLDMFEFVLADVIAGETSRIPANSFDVCFTNPPFGTKNNRGADFSFVWAALRLVRPEGTVVSLHAGGTFEGLAVRGKRVSGYRLPGRPDPAPEGTPDCAHAVLTTSLTWALPKTYCFQKKQTKDIIVSVAYTQKEL